MRDKLINMFFEDEEDYLSFRKEYHLDLITFLLALAFLSLIPLWF